MAKVRIQARSVDSEDSVNIQSQLKSHSHHHQRSKHIGALAILTRVWKREGFVGWYQVMCEDGMASTFSTFSPQGMQAQISKAVLSQALLFMSKEQFEHWAFAIMIFAARLSADRRIVI